MNHLITAKNICFSYDKKIVLDKVNFTVAKGDFIGIVGSNGAGKSTLIKLLLNIIKPKSGAIDIMGSDIWHFKEWNRIGYVSQKATSFNSGFPATVFELVGANLYPNPIIRKDRFMLKHSTRTMYRDKVCSALSRVGILDLKDKQIGQLSGGQQQRVFIARAIVNDPEMLFLDEPTTGIDIHAEDNLYCLLKELNQQSGITILMVTHDITAILAHADKLFALNSFGISEYSTKENMDNSFFKKIFNYDFDLHQH